MHLRRGLLYLLAAATGAGVVLMPALAGAEAEPTIHAVNGGIYSHYWSPSSVTVAPGGTVTLSNPTTVKHGVEWVSAKPVCEGSVPVGTTEAASGTEWSGKCTFSAPGEYAFYCTVHGPSMSGRVIVEAATTPTTPSTPSGTTSTGTVPAPGGGTTSTPAPAGAGGGAGVLASPFAGKPGSSLRVASAQRGHVVRGSVAVSGAGRGSRMEVQLLATRASLAAAGATSLVSAGRLVRRSVPAGVVRFVVPLSARAIAAARRHGRLRLTLRLELTPSHGVAASASRSLVVRP
jgi:plastocyanin